MFKEYITLVIDQKFICNEISSELYVKLLERVESMTEDSCELFLEQFVTKAATIPSGYITKIPSIPVSKTITGYRPWTPAAKTTMGHRIWPSAASKIERVGKGKIPSVKGKPITKIVKKKQEVEYR